jgi:hypothetical protein
MATDPAIREFVIGDHGITVSGPFAATSGLLTGSATPTTTPSGDVVP